MAEFEPAERARITGETQRDIFDCLLGMVFAASVIVAVVSPLGHHWETFAGALALAGGSGAWFIARWARRGVFRALGDIEEVT